MGSVTALFVRTGEIRQDPIANAAISVIATVRLPAPARAELEITQPVISALLPPGRFAG